MEGGLVKSALRVLEILELFDAERRPLRVADVVDRMNVPQSSASMLLKTLVARGYMDFDAASREYCPSVRVSFLGAWTVGDLGRREEITDAMRELAEDTGETVLLGRRSGCSCSTCLWSSRSMRCGLRCRPAPCGRCTAPQSASCC